MSGAAAWWNADVIGPAVKWMLTRGRDGTGDGTAPYPPGTLNELWETGGDWEGAPPWLVPAELPALATEFDATAPGFPVDGSFAARQPDTQAEFEFPSPFLYVWTEEATRVEDMDSECSWFDQRVLFLVRVRRDDDATAPSGSKECARSTALAISRAVLYLMTRDFAVTCRNLATAASVVDGAFGVNHVTPGQEPTLTSNYGGDGDTFADALCSVLVFQLRPTPAATSA